MNRHSAANRPILLLLLTLAGCGGSGSGTVNNPDPPVNRAPTISGSPAPAVMVDELWSFTPTASDPDGDSLTFSVENEAGWMSLDPATGLLQGTPATGDVGIYDNIVLTVRDGVLSASLGPFSVEVTQTALGSITVNWSIPTLYVDGSALSDIESTNIYYGRTSGDYPDKIEIAGTTTTSYVIEDLAPDTYYIVLTVTDGGGIESDWSDEVVVTVD